VSPVAAEFGSAEVDREVDGKSFICCMSAEFGFTPKHFNISSTELLLGY
jgi:hypothetical protein